MGRNKLLINDKPAGGVGTVLALDDRIDLGGRHLSFGAPTPTAAAARWCDGER
eukprot:SAG11_NODE_25485_length_358_cov_0.795367_1_plen_52_part_10